MTAAPVDIQIQDGISQGGFAAVQDIVADDGLVPVAEAWPIPERARAAWVDEDRVLALTPGMPAHNQAPQQIDQIADALIAVDALSRQSDERAATSSSRQSA